jgi:hypothetical protein
MFRRDRISTDKIGCKNKKLLNSKNSNKKLNDHNDSRGGGLRSRSHEFFDTFWKQKYSIFTGL